MELDQYEEVASVDDFTKYEHRVKPSTVYVFSAYSNDPVLEILSLGGDQWVTRLMTNGSFTNMKANLQGFGRSLDDGKRMLDAFGKK